MPLPHRHHVKHAHGAAADAEVRLQEQRVLTVAPAGLRMVSERTDAPITALLAPEHRGKARI
jgi:hypothetical protein